MEARREVRERHTMVGAHLHGGLFMWHARIHQFGAFMRFAVRRRSERTIRGACQTENAHLRLCSSVSLSSCAPIWSALYIGKIGRRTNGRLALDSGEQTKATKRKSLECQRKCVAHFCAGRFESQHFAPNSRRRQSD